MTKWCYTFAEYSAMIMDRSIVIKRIIKSPYRWLVEYEYRK